jgi:hypothetical protein
MIAILILLTLNFKRRFVGQTLEQDALGIAAAAVTFNVVASLSQTIQCGLKISTGRPVMAAAASFVTVIGGELLGIPRVRSHSIISRLLYFNYHRCLGVMGVR